jgi:hypothetical protein
LSRAWLVGECRPEYDLLVVAADGECQDVAGSLLGQHVRQPRGPREFRAIDLEKEVAALETGGRGRRVGRDLCDDHALPFLRLTQLDAEVGAAGYEGHRPARGGKCCGQLHRLVFAQKRQLHWITGEMRLKPFPKRLGRLDGVLADARNKVALLEAGLGRRRLGLHFLDDEPAALVPQKRHAEIAGLSGLAGAGLADLLRNSRLHCAILEQVRL